MENILNRNRVVYFTVLESQLFGDMEGCATVEVGHEWGGWSVSVSPTRALNQRGLSSWVNDRGERRLYPTASDAILAVQRERPNVPLRWCQKIRSTPSVGRRSPL